jgi:hypothetical protein
MVGLRLNHPFKKGCSFSLINSCTISKWYAKNITWKIIQKLDVLQINLKEYITKVELDAIKQFGRPSAAANVEVSEKKRHLVIGAKIFISAEDAKCIPLLTECRPLRKGQQAIDGEWSVWKRFKMQGIC